MMDGFFGSDSPSFRTIPVSSNVSSVPVMESFFGSDSHSPAFRGIPVEPVQGTTSSSNPVLESFFGSDSHSPAFRGKKPVQPGQRKATAATTTTSSSNAAKMSRSASVLKIQKVFRGFLVRKRVRTIVAIRREVDKIERRFSQRETIDLIRRDAKEQLRVNEALMGLLFKLDSVHGVDSGVRDCRKALIKKAIALQEKVSPPKVASTPFHSSESALKIQKVFRGYSVRKNVRRLVAIRSEVDDLVRRDAKERQRLNETLMALLLNLDSVSGVDSGVRDCRKAVIKKAIGLQERVDAIVAGDQTLGNDHAVEVDDSDALAKAVDRTLEIKDSAECSAAADQTLEIEEAIPASVQPAAQLEALIGDTPADQTRLKKKKTVEKETKCDPITPTIKKFPNPAPVIMSRQDPTHDPPVPSPLKETLTIPEQALLQGQTGSIASHLDLVLDPQLAATASVQQYGGSPDPALYFAQLASAMEEDEDEESPQHQPAATGQAEGPTPEAEAQAEKVFMEILASSLQNVTHVGRSGPFLDAVGILLSSTKFSSALKAELARLRDRFPTLIVNYEASIHKISENEAKLTRKDQLKDLMKNNLDRFSSLHQTKHSLTEEETQANKIIAELQARVEQINHEKDRLEVEIKRLMDETQKIQAEQTQAKKDIKTWRLEKDRSEKEVKEQEEEWAQFRLSLHEHFLRFGL